MFKTLQERLPKELALHGISDMETANRFLKDDFLPTFNADNRCLLLNQAVSLSRYWMCD